VSAYGCVRERESKSKRERACVRESERDSDLVARGRARERERERERERADLVGEALDVLLEARVIERASDDAFRVVDGVGRVR